jgi:hypothetical protein
MFPAKIIGMNPYLLEFAPVECLPVSNRLGSKAPSYRLSTMPLFCVEPVYPRLRTMLQEAAPVL